MKLIAHIVLRCLAVLTLGTAGVASGQSETLFANYFDIPTSSPAGTSVIGKVHLLRNKDAHITPVPASYNFALSQDSSGLYELVNERDSVGRLFGAIRIKSGSSAPAQPADSTATVTLYDGTTELATAPITIHVVTQTLHQHFLDYAQQNSLSQPRLYGSTKYTDAVVANMINELEAGQGVFSGYSFYTASVASFVNTGSTLTTQWKAVLNKLGGLGYAYMKSATYGPNGNPTERERLKNALLSAIRVFVSRIPIDPAQVIINGQPIGTDYGDGIFRLNEKGILPYGDLTHQWVFTDPMTGPVVWVLPALMQAEAQGDAAAKTLHEELIRFFQISFGNPINYRKLDDPTARWGDLTDTNHSEGAFSDANMGHRMRGWIELPAIWADYNRPITYAPYWYAGYSSQYPSTLYRPGWTPQGVLQDLAFWVYTDFRPAHDFAISGFLPDGTVTHHNDKGKSDVAMWAYGFEWLTASILDAYEMLRDTGIDFGSHGHQFISDRLLYSYDKAIYRGDYDFTLTGRSYYGDFKTFVKTTIVNSVDQLIAVKQPTTSFTNEAQLVQWRNSLAAGTQSVTGNFPFWVGNHMVHRSGGASSDPQSFYFSVKLTNDRTRGTEDFATIGKSYHGGSGILQAKVSGMECDIDVRKRWDWHALPGLTEEWRTDAIPADGSSQTVDPFSGMVSDGVCGFAAMRYRPGTDQTYSVARADKAFFFTGTEAIALGCNVARQAAGQNRTIITTVDQTRWEGMLSYSLNGAVPATVAQGAATDLSLPMTSATWVHQGSKGYVIFPEVSGQPLYLRGGAAVVDSDTQDTSAASILHVAIGHGIDPAAGSNTRYHYVIVPNITAAEMPAYVSSLSQLEVVGDRNLVQGIFDHNLGVAQIAFYSAATATTASGFSVTVDRPALVQLRRNGSQWEFSAEDPLHDYAATNLTVTLNAPLKTGTYPYVLGGIYPIQGENVTVTDASNGVVINVELPDPSNDAAYHFQGPLYAGVPIHVSVPVDEEPQGLTYYLPLNEGSGTTTQDVTGNGWNGTLQGGVTWAQGVFGQAVTMNGVDSSISTPVPSGLVSNTFTITGWIKRSGTQPPWSGLVYARGSGVASGLHFGTANELRFTWNGGHSGWNSGLVLPDGVWTFVALVITPTQGTIYMDAGSGLVSATRVSTITQESFTSAFNLGWDKVKPERRVVGTMDDVRIYTSSLSADQILTLSQAWRHRNVFQ